MTATKLNGYQIRTERTKAQLLAAAEEVFARDGFEGAQMEAIAKAAGRSKGAIYAHYKSKNDLFLALVEHRTRRFVGMVMESVLPCSTRPEAHVAFKKAIVNIQNNRNWIVLTIEAKLYSLRTPELKEQWHQARQKLHAEEHGAQMQWAKLIHALFGETTTAQRAELEAKISAIGPIINGLVLEAEFEPKVFSKKRLAAMVEELFEVLLRMPR